MFDDLTDCLFIQPQGSEDVDREHTRRDPDGESDLMQQQKITPPFDVAYPALPCHF
jgi:hypothetical protein